LKKKLLNHQDTKSQKKENNQKSNLTVGLDMTKKTVYSTNEGTIIIVSDR